MLAELKKLKPQRLSKNGTLLCGDVQALYIEEKKKYTVLGTYIHAIYEPLTDFSEIVQLAEKSDCRITIDANSHALLAPESMKAAFDSLASGLEGIGDYFSCAYRSLAESYRVAISELEENTREKYDKLYIVGGGAKNQFLNKLTEEATKKKVIALPIEATALGNLKIQMEIKNELH